MKKNEAKRETSDKASFGKTLRQFISFSFVGVTSIVVQYGGYLLLNLWMYYIVANIIAFILAVINSYVWNTIFVFKPNKGEAEAKSEGAGEQSAWAQEELEKEAQTESKKTKFNHGKSFVKMMITNVGYLALNTGLLKLFVEVVGLSEELAPIFCIIILTPYSFFVTKYWVYKK